MEAGSPSLVPCWSLPSALPLVATPINASISSSLPCPSLRSWMMTPGWCWSSQMQTTPMTAPKTQTLKATTPTITQVGSTHLKAGGLS